MEGVSFSYFSFFFRYLILKDRASGFYGYGYVLGRFMNPKWTPSLRLRPWKQFLSHGSALSDWLRRHSVCFSVGRHRHGVVCLLCHTQLHVWMSNLTKMINNVVFPPHLSFCLLVFRVNLLIKIAKWMLGNPSADFVFTVMNWTLSFVFYRTRHVFFLLCQSLTPTLQPLIAQSNRGVY